MTSATSGMTVGAGKYLKPYQGLKLSVDALLQLVFCRKIPKTLSGIETSGAPMPEHSVAPENT